MYFVFVSVTTHMAYYKRKHSQGYFTAQLLILKNSSAVQCASACSLTDGCSVISYYRNQKLCKLSTQGGEYVADPAWTSLILRPHEQELDGQVSTTALVSHIIDETTATSSRTDKTFEISQAVTSRPSEFMNTGAVTSHSTDFTATAPRSFEFTTATETVTSHSTQFTEITGHVKSDLTELKTTVTSHTRRFTTSSETVTSDPRDLTTTTEAVTSDPTDLTTTAETVTSYQTGFTTSTEAVTPTYSTSQPMTSSGHDTPTITSDVSECPHGYTMTSSGYCFMLLIPYHTFDQSSDICYQHSGFLASITSTVKNQEAVHMLQMRGGKIVNFFIQFNSHL